MSARPDPADRRETVVRAALLTFSRLGYRSTAMDDIARDAGISRPGLYFLFATKRALFAEAVGHALAADVDAAAASLEDRSRPLEERVVAAFDHWAGRYVGPLADVSTVIDDNPDLLGDVPDQARNRFEGLLQQAVTESCGAEGAGELVAVLCWASIGLKSRATSREDYRAGITVAARLLLGDRTEREPAR